jgi:hypothetical protein
VTKTKRILSRIDDQQRVIRGHEAKIALESEKPSPNRGLIRHWETEIGAGQKKIARLQRRLEALRRKR